LNVTRADRLEFIFLRERLNLLSYFATKTNRFKYKRVRKLIDQIVVIRNDLSTDIRQSAGIKVERNVAMFESKYRRFI
jgi:hypothetical protein